MGLQTKVSMVKLLLTALIKELTNLKVKIEVWDAHATIEQDLEQLSLHKEEVVAVAAQAQTITEKVIHSKKVV